MFPPVTPSQYFFFSEGDSLSISTPVPARPAVPRGGDGSAGQGLPEASAGWCDWTERKGGAKGTYSSHLRQGTPSLICKAINFSRVNILNILCFYSSCRGCLGRTSLVWSLVLSLGCPHYMQCLDTVIWKRYISYLVQAQHVQNITWS